MLILMVDVIALGSGPNLTALPVREGIWIYLENHNADA